MNTYTAIDEFMKDVGYTEEQFCSIVNMSRQNMYNIKTSDSNYHRFLRELIMIIVNVPEALQHLLEEHPKRFDSTAKKLTRFYLKESKKYGR